MTLIPDLGLDILRTHLPTNEVARSRLSKVRANYSPVSPHIYTHIVIQTDGTRHINRPSHTLQGQQFCCCDQWLIHSTGHNNYTNCPWTTMASMVGSHVNSCAFTWADNWGTVWLHCNQHAMETVSVLPTFVACN